ncbi:MAG: sugar phosphate isomerase/epimerase family protein [Puniceicoccaceae bacterium]
MNLAIISDEISLDLEESIRLGKEMGFHKYEFRCLDGYGHRVPDLLPGRREQLQNLVAKDEIEVTALSPGVFKIKPGDTDRLQKEMEDILPRTCVMAVELDAPRIIVFGFLREDGIPNDQVIDLLRQAAQVVDTFGLEMSIENEPGAYCDTGANTAAMVEAIGMDNVTINWDPANAHVSGEVAFPSGYEAALHHIGNVHIKDAVPIPPDKWENRLIGDGGVDWPGQLQRLLLDMPVEHLTLETHVFPLIESTREDLRRLKQLLAEAEASTKGVKA